MRPILTRAMAEVFGTFALVFFGSTAVYMTSFPSAGYGLMGIALVHAVILAIAVSATMNISGGHLNPAVTIALAAIKRISISDAGIYIVSQLGGALLAGFLAKSIWAPNVGYLKGFGAPMLGTGITFNEGVVFEIVLTFFLMSAIMGTAVAKSAPKIGGFGIGLMLFPLIMVGGPLTGAAMNPARAFGPAVAAGMMTAQAVYWIGPIVGALLGAFFWDKILMKGEEQTS